MQRDSGAGDATPGTPSPTHGGRLRHRKRSSEVILLPVNNPYRKCLWFLGLAVVDSCCNLRNLLRMLPYCLGSQRREQVQWRQPALERPEQVQVDASPDLLLAVDDGWVRVLDIYGAPLHLGHGGGHTNLHGQGALQPA